MEFSRSRACWSNLRFPAKASRRLTNEKCGAQDAPRISSPTKSWGFGVFPRHRGHVLPIIGMQLTNKTSLRTQRGRVDDLSFFDYLSPFCFLLIEFHCSFFMSYKILPDYICYCCISIRMWWAVGTSFIRARCTFFHTHASLLSVFRLSHCLISFLLFPCVSVWKNTCAWVPRFL